MQTPDCGETQELLPAFVANELDSLTSLAIQKHLDGCAACRSEARWDHELAGSLRRLSEKVPASSDALRTRLLARPPNRPFAAIFSRAAAWLRTPPGWMTLSATAATMLLLVGAFYRPAPSRAGGPLWDFVSVHVQTTAKAAPAEIATADPAEAEHWLRTHLPFEVRTPKTIPAGYRLLGARICRAGSEPAGVLLYDQGGQRISCFIQPPNALSISSETRGDAGSQHVVAARSGRQVVCGTCRGVGFAAWKEANLCYVLVADLPEQSLLAFADI